MKMDFLKWFFLLVAALAVRAQEEGEGESQPKSKPSTAPGLTLNLTYDGGTSRLALTRGLPMVLQVYDRQKLAEAKEKAEKQKKVEKGGQSIHIDLEKEKKIEDVSFPECFFFFFFFSEAQFGETGGPGEAKA